MNTPTTDRAVNEAEAAQFLGLSPATLRKMRCIGAQATGLPPIPFFKYSPRCVRYSLAELETWRAAHQQSAA